MSETLPQDCIGYQTEVIYPNGRSSTITVDQYTQLSSGEQIFTYVREPESDEAETVVHVDDSSREYGILILQPGCVFVKMSTERQRV